MLELDTYVNQTNQEIINKKYLEKVQSGGNQINSGKFYKKYCQYKSKYLKLKNMLK